MLDTLAGRQPGTIVVNGQVLLNGHASNLGYGKSAYVTQDEIMVGTLTVHEATLYAALLRLPKTMAYAEKVSLYY